MKIEAAIQNINPQLSSIHSWNGPPNKINTIRQSPRRASIRLKHSFSSALSSADKLLSSNLELKKYNRAAKTTQIINKIFILFVLLDLFVINFVFVIIFIYDQKVYVRIILTIIFFLSIRAVNHSQRNSIVFYPSNLRYRSPSFSLDFDSI